MKRIGILSWIASGIIEATKFNTCIGVNMMDTVIRLKTEQCVRIAC